MAEAQPTAADPEEAADPSLLLRLGKFEGPLPELFVLEAQSPQAACQEAAKGRKEARSPPGRPVLEDDLTLDDYGSDDEAREWQAAVASQFTPLPPNSAVSRRRMEARAQQCVVCFMEKAHTLVPPHANTVPQTSSHRFCTDCWAEYLLHCLKMGLAPGCPVCRGPIDVPDAWYVALDLPDHWCRQGLVEGQGKTDSSAVGLSWCRSSPSSPPVFWADSTGAGRGSRQTEGAAEDLGDLFGGPWQATLRWSWDRCVERLHCMIHGGPSSAAA